MSVHSAKVKRADEVVRGDWINWGGIAREVVWTIEHPGGSPVNPPIHVGTAGGRVLKYRRDELVEVIKK